MKVQESVEFARGQVGNLLNHVAAHENSKKFTAAVAAVAPNAKVAFGVGKRPLPGWINTDVTRAIGLYLDVTKPWPVAPKSVSHIYAEHVIEHLPLPLGRATFKNCAAALGHGGRVRFATPDLERAARAYLDKSEIGAAHLAYYGPTDRVTEHPVDLIRTLFSYDDHWKGYIYDFEALKDELDSAGFVDVIRVDPGESDDEVFRGLEARTDGTFFHMQLIVEATTP